MCLDARAVPPQKGIFWVSRLLQVPFCPSGKLETHKVEDRDTDLLVLHRCARPGEQEAWSPPAPGRIIITFFIKRRIGKALAMIGSRPPWHSLMGNCE